MPEHKLCDHCGGTGYLVVEWWINENLQGDYFWRGPFATRQEAERRLAEDEELNRQHRRETGPGLAEHAEPRRTQERIMNVGKHIPGSLPNRCVKVLAIIVRAARQGRTLTIRDVMRECGYRSPNAAAVPIRRLLAEGLLTNERASRYASARTLRPACEFYALPRGE